MIYQKSDIDAEGIIRRAKVLLNLDTDADLAKYIGVTPKALSSWRNKKTTMPLWYFTEIAKQQKVSYSFILDGIDKETCNLNDKNFLKEAISKLPFSDVANIFQELGFRHPSQLST